MQRVVSINLSGNAYQLEENGYNALFAYLDATEAQLKDSPDRAQALADLERLVADKCQACLGPHKNVVASGEIDRIILELGPIPGQPAAAPPPPPSSSSSTSSSSGASSAGSTSSASGSTHRRLYQIREGAMISGVCMGLSEYLHLDVTLIRILVVIFAFATNGFGMLAYGALMFILPKVRTRAEASGTPGASGPGAPHQWPWDDGWPWDKHGWPWDHPRDATPPPPPAAPPSPAQSTQSAQSAPPYDWRAQRRAERAAYRGRSPFGTFGMIITLMFAFFWLSFWTRGHFFFGWPFFWGFPHWVGIVIFFVVMRMIFMPFRMARWQRYGYGPYGAYDPYAHPHHAWVSMWNGFAWFAVMIFAVWAAYHYIPEVGDFMRNMHASFHEGGFHV